MNNIDEKLRLRLMAWPEFSSITNIERLTQQGEINQSFKLQTQGQSYLLKSLVPIHHNFPDRQAQFLLQKQLAQKDLASLPHYLSPEQDLWIEDWYEQTSIILNRHDQLIALARALINIHHCSIEAPSLCLLTDWQRYISLLAADKAILFNKQAEQLKNLWLRCSRYHQTCCHHDLSFANLANDGSSICFDWEYAAKGNCFYDIASAISVNQLSAQEIEVLLKEYAHHSKFTFEFIISQVSQFMPLVIFTNKLWFESVRQL